MLSSGRSFDESLSVFPCSGGGLVIGQGQGAQLCCIFLYLLYFNSNSYIFLYFHKFLYFTNNCGDLEVACDSLLQNGLCSRTQHVADLVWVGISLCYGACHTVP